MPVENDDFWVNFDSKIADEYSKKDWAKGTTPIQDFDPTVDKTRMILNLLFVIDTSGSMRGQRMGMVNYAMENIIKELRMRDESNAVIKIGILRFSETAEWVTPQPIALDDYEFTQLVAEPWLTNYGPAFDALGEKLSRKAFMDPNLGEYFAPVILFVTDGELTDINEYPIALQRLRHNGWFRQSAKYAIAVGDDARSKEVINIFSDFVDDINNLRYADEGEALCSLIQYVAINASKIQTSMLSSSGTNMGSSLFSEKDNNLFSSMLK